MKISFFLFLVISFYTASFTQNVQGVIKYRIILKENEDNRRNYNMASYLYFNPEKSVYVYDRLKDMEEKDKYERDPLKQKELPLPPGDTTYYPDWRKRDEYGQIFSKNNVTKTFKIREFVVGRPYFVEEPIPNIKWNILTKGKKIGKYTCQEAVTKFRGRTYHAWFTMEIPMNIGPWKLQGLPGAILEAHSEDGKVGFIAEKVEVPSNINIENEIEALNKANGKTITFEEYKTIYGKEEERFDNMVLLLIQQEMEKSGIKGGGFQKVSSPAPFRIELEFEH